MIEILGSKKDGQIVGQILETMIKKLDGIEGQYYRGFPIISTSEGGITLDGVLCSEQYGVTIFHFVDDKIITDELIEVVDEVHLKVQARLSEVSQLTKNRSLVVPIKSIVFAPQINLEQYTEFNDDFLLSRNEKQLKDNLHSNAWEYPKLLPAVLSRLQSLTNLKPKRKRSYVTKVGSKGDVLKQLEKVLATLDVNQTRAVLENIDGVQRIRGLAGSGKTIVLARKIAYIHSQNPHWNIAVTFNSRSLKNQLRRLVEVFYEDSNGEKPDWEKVNIIHAWGSPSNVGIYYNACKLHNIVYHDFSSARSLQAAGEEPFQAVCKDVVSQISDEKKLYDLVLIDEAQDFKPEFLRLCYSLLDSNKRLIYAYDELQNLGDDSMPSPEEIWGLNAEGEPKVTFNNQSQDIILNICYRTPGLVLTAAHALGFGVYRKPIIQMFDYAELWHDIGYETIEGDLTEGREVVLSRSIKSSPALLSNHNTIDELIQFRHFQGRMDEYKWVAEQIAKNINEEEILPSDIVVIHPDTRVMRNEVGTIRNYLFELGINSSIAGVTGSPDEFFCEDQVTFTSIYRAKGNEASVVYIINADYCNVGFDLARKRNILFTAMTRTKAWLRVSGCGTSFEELLNEYSQVVQNNSSLKFVYPTVDERAKMRIVNRDMTKEERRRVNQARKNAENLANLLGASVNVEDIPEEIRLALIQKLSGK